MHSDSQAAYVATRHYIDGLSRIEIADELGISRFAVARILQRARDRGIVRFEITSPGDLDLPVSMALQERYGLHHALAVITPSDAPETIRQALGRASARLLTEITAASDTIGIASGRTLLDMAASIGSLARADIVQFGGVASGIQDSGVELVRRVARISHGTPYPILAPLMVQRPESAELLRQEPIIRETIAQFSRVTIAVVGIGSWNPPDSQVYQLAQRLGLLAPLQRLGVCAELGAIMLDADGNEVDLYSDRSIAIDSAALRKVPEVIAVAGGPRKIRAISAALRSGLISSLVCDVGTARALLEQDDQAGRAGTSPTTSLSNSKEQHEVR
ncbi:MAG: sugar-binding transcriptional regulator [Leucobacter sp.]